MGDHRLVGFMSVTCPKSCTLIGSLILLLIIIIFFFILKQVQGHAYQNREEFLEHVRMMHRNSVVYNGMTPIILCIIWIESLLRSWCIPIWHKLAKKKRFMLVRGCSYTLLIFFQMHLLENWCTINFSVQLNNEIHATLPMRHKVWHCVCPLDPKNFYYCDLIAIKMRVCVKRTRSVEGISSYRYNWTTLLCMWSWGETEVGCWTNL